MSPPCAWPPTWRRSGWGSRRGARLRFSCTRHMTKRGARWSAKRASRLPPSSSRWIATRCRKALKSELDRSAGPAFLVLRYAVSPATTDQSARELEFHRLTGPVHRSSLLVWPSSNPELSEWADCVTPTTPQRDPPQHDGRDRSGRGEWRPADRDRARCHNRAPPLRVGDTPSALKNRTAHRLRRPPGSRTSPERTAPCEAEIRSTSAHGARHSGPPLRWAAVSGRRGRS